MVRYIGSRDITQLLDRKGIGPFIRQLCDYLRADFRRWEDFEKSARLASHSTQGVIELMPTSDGTLYAFKYVNGHPVNTEAGKLTVTAFGVLADVATGYPMMISEMTILTALRTAATSAMAAKALARPEHSPKGQVPFIDINGAKVADSTFIRAFLERTYGLDFDEGLDGVQRAQAWAIERMMENHFGWTMIAERWLCPANFAKGPAHFFDGAPEGVREMVQNEVRNNIRAVGVGRHTDLEIVALAVNSLAAVSAMTRFRSTADGLFEAMRYVDRERDTDNAAVRAAVVEMADCLRDFADTCRQLPERAEDSLRFYTFLVSFTGKVRSLRVGTSITSTSGVKLCTTKAMFF